MKLLVFLFFIPPALLVMNEDQLERFEHFSKPCQKESGATSEMVEETLKNVWNPDTRVKKHILCVGTALGVIWPNGKLIYPALRQRALVAADSVEEGEAVVKECCSKQYEDKEDTAFNCISCLYQKLPLYSDT